MQEVIFNKRKKYIENERLDKLENAFKSHKNFKRVGNNLLISRRNKIWMKTFHYCCYFLPRL